jgi:hypothetical protein
MKRIIVALPVCGKTYACKQINRLTDRVAIDLDIRGLKFCKTQDVKHAQTLLVLAAFNSGCDYVFTHNGAIDFSVLLPSEYSVDVVIKDIDPKKYAKQALNRGDSEEFACEIMENSDKWVDDMWKLFDDLSRNGFKVRMIVVGEHAHIWDYLQDEAELHSCDRKER